MTLWTILGEIVFVSIFLFFFLFAFVCQFEGERRASRLSFIVAASMAVANVLVFFVPPPFRDWIFLTVFLLFFMILLFLLISPKPRQTLRLLGPIHKVDERDVIFARFDLEKGQPSYEEYYKRYPYLKAPDDEIRKLPDILSPHHIKKSPVHFNLAAAEFEFLEKQLSFVDGQVLAPPSGRTPEENTADIKKMLLYLGADLCGICELDQNFVYSFVGRGPEPWGKKIDLRHGYAVVFAVEMEHGMIAAAPQSPVIIETAKKYVEAARISIIAAQQIRKMGYAARAHIAGSNYQIMLPPLGWKAGLGELGRFGMLLTWRFGARMRLGALTTDLPLIPDKPVAFGIQDYCEICKKCAENCPSQAIPHGKKRVENGVQKWVLDREACYRYWRKVGTDCALCISVCPFSKPDNGLHRFIRLFTNWSKKAQSLTLWGDDLFYGRTPKRKSLPF